MNLNEDEMKFFNNIVANNINVNKGNIDSNLKQLKTFDRKLSNHCNVYHLKHLKTYLKKQTDLALEFKRIRTYEKKEQKKIDDF
jgi:hypothetical protein